MYTARGIALDRRVPARRNPRRLAPLGASPHRGRSFTARDGGSSPRRHLGYDLCGGSPAPLGWGGPDAMERYPKQIHVRMSEGEVARAKALASKLDMTLSDLIRCLLQLPDESIEGGARLVVVDRATAVKLSREMRRWGHHYNQAVHALNAIAYYLRANDMDSSDVIEELDRTSGRLVAMQPGIAALRADAEAILGAAMAALGR